MGKHTRKGAMINMRNATALAKAYMQVWSAGNIDLLDLLAHANLTVEYSHFPGPVQGVEPFKEVLHQTHATFPDLLLTVNEVIDAGAYVTVRWSYRGTHRHGEVFGVAAAGTKVRVAGISILTIEEDKVSVERGIVDNFTLLQQLQRGE